LQLEDGENPARNVRGLAGIQDSVKEDGELVASEPRDRVTRAHRPLEPAPDLLKNRVAGRMAEAVVDGLEIVEIDEHDPDCRAAATRALDGVVDSVCEQRPVGEARHGVVERLVRQLVLEFLSFADVAAVQHDAAHVLVLEQVRVLHLELEPGAVAMPERALDHVRLHTASDIGLADAGHDLLESRAICLLQ
jgi:hypothetical protein